MGLWSRSQARKFLTTASDKTPPPSKNRPMQTTNGPSNVLTKHIAKNKPQPKLKDSRLNAPPPVARHIIKLPTIRMRARSSVTSLLITPRKNQNQMAVTRKSIGNPFAAENLWPLNSLNQSTPTSKRTRVQISPGPANEENRQNKQQRTNEITPPANSNLARTAQTEPTHTSTSVMSVSSSSDEEEAARAAVATRISYNRFLLHDKLLAAEEMSTASKTFDGVDQEIIEELEQSVAELASVSLEMDREEFLEKITDISYSAEQAYRKIDPGIQPVRIIARVFPNSTMASVERTSSVTGTAISVTLHGTIRDNTTTYKFDGVISPHDKSNTPLYIHISPFILHLFKGVNSMIFMIGNSGTGKTYSTVGPTYHPGVVPKLIEEIIIRRTPNQAFYVSIAQFLKTEEDLLRLAISKNQKEVAARRTARRLPLRPDNVDSSEAASVEYRYMHNTDVFLLVTTVEDTMKFIKGALAFRTIGNSDNNDTSSRAHCIISICKKEPNCADTYLDIVDFCGSESRENITDPILKETSDLINESNSDLSTQLGNHAVGNSVRSLRKTSAKRLSRLVTGTYCLVILHVDLSDANSRGNGGRLRDAHNLIEERNKNVNQAKRRSERCHRTL